MNRAGWIGVVLIGAGVLMIWAGFTGQDVLAALRSILRNEPLPGDLPGQLDTGSTAGARGESAFTEDGGAAGEGSFDGGGGGW